MKSKKTVTKVIVVDGMQINLQMKPIKNFILKVKPPEGAISVSAPIEANIEHIEKFVRKRKAWIQKWQEKILDKKEHTELPQDFILQTGNKFPLWGKEYVLHLSTTQGKERIEIEGDQLIMEVKEFRNDTNRLQMLYDWYWNALGFAIPDASLKYLNRMDVYPREWHIRDMTTRWGSCSIKAERIWLSLALVAKDPRCLEYVIVHELCHLLEPGHNAIFWGYVEQYYPDYKEAKELLKAAPHFPRFKGSVK